MDQPSAPQSETLQPPDEAWRRLTLLDLMILFSGHEAALGFMKWYGLIDYDPPGFNGIWIPIRMLLIGYVFIFLGASFSVPIIIAVQFYSRHRRARLAGGEILAVVTVIHWIIAFLVVILFPYGFAGLEVIIGISAIGLLILYLNLKSSLYQKPCLWLSIYGSTIFSSSILFLIFILILEKFFGL
jgi:hypothetical protein